MVLNGDISRSMTIQLSETCDQLPQMPEFVKDVRRAPKRNFSLSRKETELALKNALRYIPEEWHRQLAPEFLGELLTTGRIYGYRFRPFPLDSYHCIDQPVWLLCFLEA